MDIDESTILIISAVICFLGCLTLLGLLVISIIVFWVWQRRKKTTFQPPVPTHAFPQGKQNVSRVKVWGSNLLWLFLTPASFIGIYLIIASIAAFIFSLAFSSGGGVVVFCLGLATIIGFGQGIYMIFKSYLQRCPSCGAWNQKREDEKRREMLSSRTGYKTITRTDIVTNSKGEKIGETSRSEQVRVLIRLYRRHYLCGFCGNHSQDTYETETENFRE